MSAQMVRQRGVTGQESLILVRNMMRAGVSTVSYLRNIFPDELFADKVVAGVNLKTLMPNTKEVRMVMDWLEKGVFDALEKQYLKAMSFVILDTCGEVRESYDFHVGYSDEEGVEMMLDVTGSQAPTKETVAKSMKLVLRKLITLTQSMPELPERRTVTMKIVYDPKTPEEYEPPFFSAAGEEERKRFTHHDNGIVELSMGDVKTHYHTMELRCVASRQWMETPQVSQTQGESQPTFEARLRNTNPSPQDVVCAQVLVHLFESSQTPTPTASQIASALSKPPNTVRHSLSQLQAYGFLSPSHKPIVNEDTTRVVNMIHANPTYSRKPSGDDRKRPLPEPDVGFWYGDEPKISIIAKPLKQARLL